MKNKPYQININKMLWGEYEVQLQVGNQYFVVGNIWTSKKEAKGYAKMLEKALKKIAGDK